MMFPGEKENGLTAQPTGLSPALRAQEVVIDFIGGNCPVQAEGTVDGRPFYFRARGEHWSLEVHPTATGQYLSWPDDIPPWLIEQEWGEEPFDAGWMAKDTALAIIEAGCALWRATRAPYKCDSLNVSPERLQELRELFGVCDQPRGQSAAEDASSEGVIPNPVDPTPGERGDQ